MIRFNPWAQLYDMIAGPSQQCGRVLAIHSDNSMDVQILGSGVLRIKGSGYAVGSNVFFKGDSVIGNAPNGSIIEVDV